MLMNFLVLWQKWKFMFEIRLKRCLLASLWERVSLCMRFKASTKVENNRTILDRFLFSEFEKDPVKPLKEKKAT